MKKLRALFCFLSAVSLTANAVIIGVDDRHPVNSKEHPYNKVLRVSTGCSSVLVGETLLLTAAHCVEEQVIDIVNTNVTFKPKSLHVTGEDQLVVLAYITKGKVGTVRSEEFGGLDWALLELDRPLGRSPQAGGLGFLAIADALRIGTDDTKDFISAGYPLDRPHDGLLAHVGCDAMLFYNDQTIRVNCDAWGGNSGGPILKKSAKGEWQILGIMIRGNRKHVPQERANPYIGNVMLNSSAFVGEFKKYFNPSPVK